ncbi:MAG: hypothetical protein EZS28_022638 [Streblomastix strix]|uniref:Tc1-like transposase DDE domain-containing protein n=1 Tax=Streblomastix strix TaxID=222440 RepID=A0A5J4VH57_9EUKA|nr:MAG: hypothetical protein EZS28_022638 [Streblomastix strix]
MDSSYIIKVKSRPTAPRKAIVEQKVVLMELKLIYVHFDNATSHNSHAITKFLQKNKIICVAHPPSSPDLYPCDYFLFGHMKRNLQGNTFKTVEEAVDVASKILFSIPKNMLCSCFENWRTRAWNVNQNDRFYFK